MATVGYGRVSTASGEQLSALRTQLSWLHDQACDLVLHDVESGLNPERSNYTTLLELIRNGTATTICATRADRLGRDGTELIRLVEQADAAGVTIITRDEGALSAKTAEELLLLYVRAALAQGESMKISLRVNAGLKQGRALGRPMRKPCWGYQLSRDKSCLEPDPEAFPRARRLIDQLIDHNWRMLPTLKAFPEPCPLNNIRSFRAWLLNPTIRGAIAYKQLPNHQYEEILWDRHQPLMTHEEFATFQRQLKINRKNWGANATRKIRPLTGLCVCSECGKRMTYVAQRKHASLKCKGDKCSQLYRSTREELIIRYALNALTTKAAEAMAAAVNQPISPEIIELQRQIEALQRLNDPDTQPLITAKKNKLQSLIAAPQTDQLMLEKISHPRWDDHATREDLVEIFHALIDTITITKQQPTAIKLRI